MTFKPGALRSPEASTTHVHNVIGSGHDRDARTRRAVPIKLDAKRAYRGDEIAPPHCVTLTTFSIQVNSVLHRITASTPHRIDIRPTGWRTERDPLQPDR